MIKIAPSILAADYLRLGEQIDLAGEAGADWLHFDVMDGRFVPNIGFGQEMLKAVSGRSNLPLDVHLMVEKPDRCIETFAEAGASIITIHAEVAYHLHRLLHRIRELGCKAGVALNPSTPPECLRYVLGDFDLALVMTVNPGYGGQKLIPSALKRCPTCARCSPRPAHRPISRSTAACASTTCARSPITARPFWSLARPSSGPPIRRRSSGRRARGSAERIKHK